MEIGDVGTVAIEVVSPCNEDVKRSVESVIRVVKHEIFFPVTAHD